MKIIRKLAVLLAVLGLATALTACEEEGPMEQAGKAVDDAAEDTKDKVKDAME
jgi:predicted small lipoprotein YifL